MNLDVENDIKQRQIDEKLAAIRAQKTNNLFFLPSGGPLTDDHIVRLDDTHSMPVAATAPPRIVRNCSH